MLGEVAGDRGDGVAHPLVGAGEEAEDGRQQHRGVQGVGVVVLTQHPGVADAVGQDVGPDLLRRRRPLRLQVGVVADRGQLGRPVECDPAHQLGRHVVLRSAAGLPDALVRLAPHRRRALGLGLDQRPQPSRQVLAASGVQQEGVQDGAEDVVLPLVEGAVADPHRAGALVSRQVVAGRLGEVPAAVDAVHDLQAAVLGRLQVGHELHELVGLPVQVEVVQRLQRERGVPHPGVAVVPVALAARRLGQRGGQRGHRRTGRHVRQPLDGQRRALQRVPQRVVGDPGPGQPAAPEGDRGVDPGDGVVRRGGGGEPVRPGQRAERALALGQDVPGTGGAALDADEHVGHQAQPASCPRRVGCVPFLDEAPLGRCAPVVEGRLADQLHLHRPLEALHGAHEQVLGVPVGRRPGVRGHQVGTLARAHREGVVHDDPAAGRVPGGGQDVGARHVRAGGGHVDAVGAEPERAGPAVQQVAERAGRVEGRHAQPVHRAVRCDERAGVAVGEERVVRDRRERRAAIGHRGTPSPAGCPETRRPVPLPPHPRGVRPPSRRCSRPSRIS